MPVSQSCAMLDGMTLYDDTWRDYPCVEWSGSCRTPDGHVRIRHNGKVESLHRITWMKTIGSIPDGMCVLHKCDNPPCYEINHLFLGSQRDNSDDRDSKGRTAKGLNNGRAKLSDAQIRAIRAEHAESNISNLELASKYNVSSPYICNVLKGRRRPNA